MTDTLIFTILVVEDHADTRASVEKILLNAGHDVVLASDGKYVADILAKQKIDLVITDMVMPEIDGIEVLLMMRRSPRKVPVIAMSGYGANSPGNYLATAQLFGVRETLEKPFTNDQLLAAVRRSLGKTTFEPES